MGCKSSAKINGINEETSIIQEVLTKEKINFNVKKSRIDPKQAR